MPNFGLYFNIRARVGGQKLCDESGVSVRSGVIARHSFLSVTGLDRPPCLLFACINRCAELSARRSASLQFDDELC